MGIIKEFFSRLINKSMDDEILSLASELTYKLVLALFPFLIFLMTILGFLNIDGNLLLMEVSPYLPEQIIDDIITPFVDEVINTKNITLLSTSLLIAVYSASSGFRAVMRGINKSYGVKEQRNIFVTILMSFGLMLLFTLTIILTLATIIFGDFFIDLLSEYFTLSTNSIHFLDTVLYFVTLFVILFSIMIIYKISCIKPIKLIDTLPGATITVTLWLIFSKIFNIYVNEYSKYSSFYGSIGSVFILLLWINLIAFILILGSEINALIESYES